MSELLVYAPPKSAAFGHEARTRDPKTAWSLTERFLSAHTVPTLRKDVRFECWAPNDWTDTEVANASLETARANFGRERDDSHTVRHWALAPEQLQTALDLFFACDRWRQQDMGPIVVNICYDFYWRIFADAPVRKSRLGVTFNRQRVFLRPSFVFPFPWDSREYVDWLDVITASAPFRFRDEYFKRAIPTKSGDDYRVLKLLKGWRTAA